MKKFIFSVLILVVISFSGYAQDCSSTALQQKAGTWKEGLKGSVSGVDAKDLVREQNVVSALHAMIKSRYKPMGVTVDFSGAYNAVEPTMPGNGYSYHVLPLNYYCEGSVIKTSHETSTHFSIKVNFMDAEIYAAAQGDRASAEGFNVMEDIPVEKDGHYHFKEKDVTLGFGMPGKSRTWLVTYDGKLPFDYVTKKEFLEKRKQNLAAEMLSSSSGYKDVLKNIEIEKGYKEKEYKNDPSKLEKYMKMDYLSTKDRYEKLLAENEKKYRPAFTKVESLLELPSTELGGRAIVKQDPKDHLSYLFTDDEDPFGKILIKPNPAYFNMKLPRSSPQFFSVDIVGNHKDPIAAKAMADIIKSVDFPTLKNMLGK